MRILQNQTGVQAPSSNYPKGRVQNNLTNWQESIVGDFIQLFQKFVIESGITENSLPDNVTNGYQLAEAMNLYIRKYNGGYVTHDPTNGDLNVNDSTTIIRINNDLGQGLEVNINLPDPSNQYNFGKTIHFIIDCEAVPSSDEINIRTGITTLINRYLADGWKEYISVKSNGTTWYVTSQNIIGTTVHPGVYIQASPTNRINATADRVITSAHQMSESAPGIAEKSTLSELHAATPNKVVDSLLYSTGFIFNTLTIEEVREGIGANQLLNIISQNIIYTRVGKYYDIQGYVTTRVININVDHIQINLSPIAPSGINGNFQAPASIVLQSIDNPLTAYCQASTNTRMSVYTHDSIPTSYDVKIVFRINLEIL